MKKKNSICNNVNSANCSEIVDNLDECKFDYSTKEDID